MAARAYLMPCVRQSDEDGNITLGLDAEKRRRDAVVLGLSLPAFTLVRVIISLIGIGAWRRYRPMALA